MKSLILFSLIFLLNLNASYWNTSITKDEMTGEKNGYVSSKVIPPTKKLGSPYSNTQSWLGVGCNSSEEWAYFGFSQAPNLLNTKTENGYSEILTRIKFNNHIENILLTQKWGSEFIHISSSKNYINKMIKSKSLLLELDWYGNGIVYFKFNLIGFTKALNKIRKECKKLNPIKKDLKEELKNECLKQGKTWRYGENHNIICGS